MQYLLTWHAPFSTICVISSSRFGRIMSYILYLLPNRGIWRIKHEGICKKYGKEQDQNLSSLYNIDTFTARQVMRIKTTVKRKEFSRRTTLNCQKLHKKKWKAFQSYKMILKRNGCQKRKELIKLVWLQILDHCFEVLRRFAWQKGKLSHRASFNFFTWLLSNAVLSTTRSRDTEQGSVAKKQGIVALSTVWERLQPSLRDQKNLATMLNKR